VVSHGNQVWLAEWLGRARGDPFLMLDFRTLGLHLESGPAGRYGDDDVVEEILRALGSGRLHLCRRRRMRESAGGAAPPPAAKEEAPLAAARRQRKTWVEFEVVDMEGNPAAGCKYLVMLPDGSLQEGSLNRTGVVRFENIDPENSVFTLPELDQEAWERA
jgi:hypothetical protein